MGRDISMKNDLKILWNNRNHMPRLKYKNIVLYLWNKIKYLHKFKLITEAF